MSTAYHESCQSTVKSVTVETEVMFQSHEHRLPRALLKYCQEWDSRDRSNVSALCVPPAMSLAQVIPSVGQWREAKFQRHEQCLPQIWLKYCQEWNS
jgi:hypothetical protein